MTSFVFKRGSSALPAIVDAILRVIKKDPQKHRRCWGLVLVSSAAQVSV